jgi:hypothetical protein
MSIKKDLGQFFTTNSDYILNGFEDFVRGKEILDPFAGSGDLLKWAAKNGAKSIYGLDIDPKLTNNIIKLNDSLETIPRAEFNITNPPYLASNKMTLGQKKARPMTEYEDLYLLSIKKILESNPNEGIIIVPVNFFSAENSDAIRVEFLNHFTIDKVNYFKEQVFEDTTYNVVAIHYIRKLIPSIKQKIEFTIFPEEKTKTFNLESKFNYRIAGKSLSNILNTEKIGIFRLTEAHMAENMGDKKITTIFNDKNTPRDYLVTKEFKNIINRNIILLNCIDTNLDEDGWIKAEDIRELGYSCLVGKNTSRNIAYVILPEVSLKDQERIIPLFNNKLNTLRKRYKSLFLTNFRDNNRKRISFDFCYKLIACCYEQL